jgi:hypothetical protein
MRHNYHFLFGLFLSWMTMIKRCGTMWKSDGLLIIRHILCLLLSSLARVIGCSCMCVHDLNMRHSFLSGILLFCLRLHTTLCTHLTNTFADMWTFAFNCLIYLVLCVEMKKNWYVMLKGKVSGVYDDWDDCLAQVNEFLGNSYKGQRGGGS